MAGALIAPLVGSVASNVVGGLMGGGGGGGSSAPPPASPTGYYGNLPSYSPVANGIDALMSGLGMAGIGPLSNADLQKSAAMADPFSGQRSQYFGTLSGVSVAAAGQANNAAGLIGQYMQGMVPFLQGGQTVGSGYGVAGTGLAGYTGQASVDPNIYKTAGTATMNPALAAMGTSDPSMAFRYGMGLDAVNRGAAATGMLGSGGMATELEQYGQGFASQEYQNMFNRQTQLQQLSSGLQAQNFGQLVQANQLGIGTQQQNWAQMFGLQGLYDQEFNQQAGRLLSGYQTAMGIQGQQVNQELGVGNLLATLSGATTGSPAMAAKISAGAYGQSQDNLANFLRGISGIPGMMGGGAPSFGGGGPSFGGSFDPSSTFGPNVINGYNGGYYDTTSGLTGFGSSATGGWGPSFDTSGNYSPGTGYDSSGLSGYGGGMFDNVSYGGGGA